MSERMPLQTTSVPIEKSVFQIVQLLKTVGFNDVAQIDRSGQITIFASRGKATFRFEPNIIGVLDVLSPKSRIRRDKLRPQAERIAWRILYQRLKGVYDSIRWDVESFGKVFAGNLITAKSDSGETLGDTLTVGIADGTLNGSNLIAGLLPEPEEKK